jgi:hypothetical protein
MSIYEKINSSFIMPLFAEFINDCKTRGYIYNLTAADINEREACLNYFMVDYGPRNKDTLFSINPEAFDSFIKFGCEELKEEILDLRSIVKSKDSRPRFIAKLNDLEKMHLLALRIL